MKVSAISQIDSEENYAKRALSVQMSNSFMSSPEVDKPVEQAEVEKKPAKLGIENLQEFTIFPKQVIDGKTIITA